ncbi:glycosyltransferase family 4 protein [Flavobacterium gawalongense]|uniref:Glycosyltransferase family 4 protein n=1 Tax=Flavobacterium gawalongense TaxID=2594432 RepID=A0A553BYU5_9FLAO|nr:glycosyltransferase family 4 protein [Flavobacterium gawalongense]TRX13491.1 glycosyltransferase family 4 protein [Flavobacterium gawalongense]TRX15577.1 glycosyltransferase family 4 protein [Flavobacterium gawalongense]TRX31416.1 glycosyltransferase family 4 protein [Flavobacterium gawalongense]
MKIAFLTPEYPHPKTGTSGGIGTSIQNLALGLIQQGCSVRVLVYGQKEDGVFYDNGICIQQIKNVKLKGLSWYLTRKKLQKIIDTLYQEKEIDLVEASDWTGITSFIRPKKCKIVIRLNGSDTYFCHLDQRPVKWINKFHEKRALQKADALLSVSQFTADKTNEVFGLERKFTIIPNSIDMGLFSQNNNDSENNKGNNTILYFGSLIRKKGLLELPLIFNEVIKKKSDAKLVLVGRDVSDILSGNVSTWHMMQGLFTEQARTNVNYLGSVPYQDIKKQINAATVCVFPTFAEALPVSWIEAMAMQKTIVASNIGWAKEIIDDGINGFLVHPTDHTVYANRIIDLLENKELQKEFGLKAREKVVQKFSMEIVAQQSLSFYQQLINSK